MYGPHDHFDIERSHALGAIIKKYMMQKKKISIKLKFGVQENRFESGFMLKMAQKLLLGL